MTTAAQQKFMGFSTPGDQKVQVTVREWQGMKLAMWRAMTAMDIIGRTAEEIAATCQHVEGCPGAESETEPCLRPEYRGILQTEEAQAMGAPTTELVKAGCPDRELRMSALVIVNAARAFTPINARRPSADAYMAPSREYFSEMISNLGAAQVQISYLHEALKNAGIDPPTAPPNELEEVK